MTQREQNLRPNIILGRIRKKRRRRQNKKEIRNEGERNSKANNKKN